MLHQLFYAAALCASSVCVSALHLPNSLPNPSVQQPVLHDPQNTTIETDSKALQDVLEALESMQETYFDNFAGTWADAIDWTAAVTGNHISAALTGIIDGLNLSFEKGCSDALRWENIVNKYFTQTAFFYFGENALGLRNQAFDDMLWVVLGWLESIKFGDMYARRHASGREFESSAWHGLQLRPLAAHRARIFYELASRGWDESLCSGGMVWNPSLTPYKNAITNELFAAASISMYLHFPGDNNSAPFFDAKDERFCEPHNPVYLENAMKAYKWLKESNMRNERGLYQDGFHITGWRRYRNGTVDPGTGQCDELDAMVYTYNQGVLLTANRGLWLATGASSYLEDGHELITSVIEATGWPSQNKVWKGLGRGGVLEEFCDHGLYCSQDGQTFKGIFFLHMTEFCRPLRPSEKDLFAKFTSSGFDEEAYKFHLARCASYRPWVDHNAEAALVTKNEDGLFGMWWGVPYKTRDIAEWESLADQQELPEGAVDHLNPIPHFRPSFYDHDHDLNDRGRGRTVETQGGALAVFRARWHWQAFYR